MAREPAEIAALRRALGDRLAAFRQAADLTQGQLARVAFCDRTSVVHIEKGRRSADEGFWTRADGAVGAGGSLLAGFFELEAARLEHEQRRRAEAVAAAQARVAAWQGESASKNLASSNVSDFLMSTPSTPAASVGPSSWIEVPGLNPDERQHLAAALTDAGRHLDSSVVGYFRRQLDACEADDGTFGPAKALPGVLGILGVIDHRAREVKPRVRCELLSVGARGAEFAGWLYRDMYRLDRATFCYGRATEWAQEAGDLPLQGYILLRKSQMAYDERDAVRVLTLAQAAQYGPWQLPDRVRAEVALQEARGLAMLGEPMAIVERKLDDACRFRTEVTSDEELQSRLDSSFNEGTLTLQKASCYVEAGKPRRAAELYEQVLSADLLSHRDRGYFLARSASALALAGEPDEAADRGLEAIQLASTTASQRTKQELMRALATLEPWRNRPGPRALREAVASPSPVTHPPP